MEANRLRIDGNMRIAVMVLIFLFNINLVWCERYNVPVFPGAQGFGTDTPAGRGGRIIKVKNLTDRGEGSLREAISYTGPRIIVFEVGGIIELVSDLTIKNPFITIAGQTAPSPGILLKGAGVKIMTNDVLIQHIRVRVGDKNEKINPINSDAIQVNGPSANRVVIDHVSASWAIDENASTFYQVRDITISNSIMSEGLKNSLHPKGSHSMGMLIGENAKNITFFGNLLAHNNERNPRIMQGSSSVVLNNVFYNAGAYEFTPVGVSVNYPADSALLSIVGNVYLKGPNTTATTAIAVSSKLVSSGTAIYQKDNYFNGGTAFRESMVGDPVVSTPTIWWTGLTVLPSDQVEANVSANAGARPADRDSVDNRIVNEVRTRTGKHVNSQDDVGGWPNLKPTFRRFNVPANPHDDDDNDGYTNIEETLHFMAAKVEVHL